MLRRRMRFECMGEKKINNQTELPKDEDGRIPPYYVITPNEQGIFNFDVSPDELKQIMELSDKAKRPLGEDGFKNLDIKRTKLKVLNKFAEPFDTYATTFLNAQKGRGNSIDTIKHYKQTIKKMEIFFYWLWCRRRNMDYDAIDTKEKKAAAGAMMPYAILEDTEFDAMFREFLLEEEEVSEQTVATYFRDYRAIAYSGMDEGLIEKRAIVVKTVYSDPKEVYTDDEIDKLLKKPDEDAPFTEYRNWAAINWVLATGNRIGTVCNVKITDVDFNENMITIGKQKNKKVMRISMIKALRDVLYYYINEFLIDEEGNFRTVYLFPSSYTDLYNQPISRISLGHSIRLYNISRGVNKTSFHLFRHTFVKKWILDGGDLPSLQRILGHSSLNMVVHYANLYSDDLRPKMEEHSVLAKHKSNKARGRMIQRRKH